MAEITSRERVLRAYEHGQGDRVPICDTPWPATVERWHAEGLPKDVHYTEYFGLDRVHLVEVDITPRYKETVVEETSEYSIYKTKWGATERNWKHAATIPEYLDFTTTDPDKWAEAKARMTPTPDRIPWAWFENEYPKCRERGEWVQAKFRIGYEPVHAFAVGTERVLMAMVTDPEWIVDMFEHYLFMCTTLFDMILDKGYQFDAVGWTDDMGYKQAQFFSVDMYRELLKPIHRRAAEWGRDRGMKVKFHSCGDIRPFLPEFVDMGIDGLHPLEVKAGMDPLQVKKDFGDKLLLHGGVDALLWDDVEKMEAYVRKVLPGMKEGGGYIFSTDHTIPSSASLEDFRHIVELVKELGQFG